MELNERRPGALDLFKEDEMENSDSWRLLDDEFEKPQTFLMPMLRHAGANHEASKGVQGRTAWSFHVGCSRTS